MHIVPKSTFKIEEITSVKSQKLKMIPLILSLFALFILGCQPKNPAAVTVDRIDQDHNVNAVLYVQNAPECKALYLQAYNWASQILLQKQTAGVLSDSSAIVIDIDETVLDNSPSMGKMIKDNEGFPHGWQEWVALAKAEPLPGVLAFLKLADSLGVTIFYVSNRHHKNLGPSMKNLNTLGFPQIDSAHFKLKTTSSSKEERRKSVDQGHQIELLLGDNLNDFAEVFEKTKGEERSKAVDDLRDEFGDRFILLPNPMYGAWLYEINKNKEEGMTEPQARMKSVRGF